MIWVALFSQTGSEIVRLTEILNRKPNLIATNNFKTDTYHPYIRGSVNIIASHKYLMQYFRLNNETSYLITLHGYLRIIPPDLCSKYTIYNGHPANIEDYLELRGKDPQERTWMNIQNYHTIGSVVHRCTEEVDGGNVVSRHYKVNTCKTKEELYQTLRETSLHAWEIFLKEQLCASG